jgi:hypothetical protein
MQSASLISIQMKEFIEKNHPKKPIFPWSALEITYCPFIIKYGDFTLQELDNTKILCLIDIGILEEGLKYRYINTLFDDLIFIRVNGFDKFADNMLLRISNPTWITDLYTFANIYVKKKITTMGQNAIPTENSNINIDSTAINIKCEKEANMYDGKYLYRRMKDFIERNKDSAPLFPWVSLAIIYCHMLYKYASLTIDELEETKYNCILDIALYPNGKSLVYIKTLFDDFILIRKTSFENFEGVMMHRIMYPEWDSSWMYDFYIFAEIYRQKNIFSKK